MQQIRTQNWNVNLAQYWPDVHALRKTLVCESRSGDALNQEARCAADVESLPSAPWFNICEPVFLKTHREPKPWGAEIWYTGIENRGICSVESARGAVLSLPEYLALQGGPKKQIETPPLLKILDPLADRQRGNLYIEVHQKKWETYIVTFVSEELYPDGMGDVLFGFSSAKLASFEGDQRAFRAALLADVKRYESLRRQLDGESQADSSHVPGYPVSDDVQRRAEELWSQVRSYFHLRKVRVGDVIQVPAGVPHSLQAGVRVVEFQTPTYERLILAFNQKVLTQSHWDSERAIEQAHFTQTHSESQPLAHGAWDVVVNFPEFSVQRASCAPRDELVITPSEASNVSLLFVISGQLEIFTGQGVSHLTVCAGQAVLLPWVQPQVPFRVRNTGTHAALVLRV